jgi:hypothetical protein
MIGDMARRFRFLLVQALLMPALAWPPALAGKADVRGRPLLEVLRTLQERGLDIIFSTAVVDQRAVVTVEPDTSDPRALLDAILDPLGLLARDGPSGSILIVRAPPGSRSGALRGRVVSRARGAAIAGATVSVVGHPRSAATRADGTFELDGIPDGTWDVLVEALGFESRTMGPVQVRPGETSGLSVSLPALPSYLEEVVVVPSRVSVMQQDQNPGLTVQDEHALLAPTFGGDVSRIIEQLPGVAAPDNSAAFNVRGSLPGDVSIFLDGLELYDPFHLRDLQSPFSLLNMNLVERADFIGGPFTADLGDRHGGVVNLSSWTPDDPHSTRVEAGTLNSSFAHGGPLPHAPAAWLVSARLWYPEALGNNIEMGESGLDPRFEDAYLRFSYNVSPRTVLSAHGLLARDELAFEEPDGSESVDATGRSGYFWLRGVRLWPGDVVTDTVVSAGRLERSRRGFSDPRDSPFRVLDDRAMNFWGVRNDLTWKISEAHLLKAGLEARLLDASYRYESGPTDDASEGTSLRLVPSGTAMSGYAAWRAGVTPRIATEAGLRWDRQGHTEERQLSPRLHAVFRMGERSELRVGLGQYFQSQRIHELDIEDGQTSFHPAELSRQAGLTFQHTLPGNLRIRFDAYHRKLYNLRPRYENLFNTVEFYPETEPDRVLVSAEHARLRGAELLLQSPSGTPLQWWIGYAWSSAEDVVDGDGVARSWDQPHAVKFLVGYRAADRWSLSLSGLGHTGWPTTTMTATATTLPDGSVEFDAVPTARNAERLPTYLRLDLKASRGFAVPGGRLRLDLEVRNVTNRDNACCVDEFRLRQRSDGTVRVDPVLEDWLGMTPSFSLVWEF